MTFVYFIQLVLNFRNFKTSRFYISCSIPKSIKVHNFFQNEACDSVQSALINGGLSNLITGWSKHQLKASCFYLQQNYRNRCINKRIDTKHISLGFPCRLLSTTDILNSCSTFITHLVKSFQKSPSSEVLKNWKLCLDWTTNLQLESSLQCFQIVRADRSASRWASGTWGGGLFVRIVRVRILKIPH